MVWRCMYARIDSGMYIDDGHTPSKVGVQIASVIPLLSAY